jgi:hypothetical protein
VRERPGTRVDIYEARFEESNMRFNSTKSVLFLALAVALVATHGYAESIPKTDLPVVITSCGQSPGSTMIKVIFMKMKLEKGAFEENSLVTADELRAKKDAGAPINTLIITMGASLKGMGAAGISIEDELARTAALIEEARSQGITVIGAHIEGMKRRAQGAAPGDNTDEQSIDAVAPNVDLLVVKKEGNTDGRFTTIANNKDIPLIEVEKTLDLMTEFEKLFKK